MAGLLDPAILALQRRQAGVVSRSQAMQAGLTGVQIDRLVARRRWTPLHPRVYLAADHPYTDEARVRAAVLWAGDEAVPSGLAALWWHGLAPALPERIVLTAPGRCPDPAAGVVVHPRALRGDDVVPLQGLTVPVLPLALLDAAVEAGEGGPALVRALRAHVDPAALQAAVGRALGRTAARRLLTDVSCTPPRPGPEWVRSRNRYS